MMYCPGISYGCVAAESDSSRTGRLAERIGLVVASFVEQAQVAIVRANPIARTAVFRGVRVATSRRVAESCFAMLSSQLIIRSAARLAWGAGSPRTVAS